MSEKKVGKRLLTWVLVLVMTLSLLPLNVLADEVSGESNVVYGHYDGAGWVKDETGTGTDTPTNVVGVDSVSKTAVPTGNPNEYTVTLQVQMHTTTTTETSYAQAATVLVIDTSGSMACPKKEHTHDWSCDLFGCSEEEHTHSPACDCRLKDAKAAAIDFLDSYKAGGTGRYVALVRFSTDAEVAAAGWQDVSTDAGYNAILASINNLSANGGTNLEQGLAKAQDLLGNSTIGSIASKNIIALTDGKPTYYNEPYDHSRLGIFPDIRPDGDGGDCDKETFKATQGKAEEILNMGYSLYSICFGAANEEVKNPYTNKKISLFEYLNSYIAPGKTYSADDFDGLKDAFDAISKEITTGLSSGTVHDSLPTGVTSDAILNRTVEWDLNTFDKETSTNGPEGNTTTTYTYTKRYTVTIDPTQIQGIQDGDYYPLNGPTTLTVKDSNDEDVIIDFPIPAGKVTLPEPEKYTYTLTYNANGGSGAPEKQEVKDSTDASMNFTVSSTKPTRDGYTFLGWATTSDATTPNVGETVTVTKDSPSATIYAVWKQNTYTYTLKYDANGGSGAPDNQEVKDSTDVSKDFTVSPTKPTRDGYTFLGWATTSDATTPNVGETVTVTKDSPSATIYAVWQQNKYTYTLTYNANGGSGAPAAVSDNKADDTVDLDYSNQPTHAQQDGKNVIFIGWTETNDSGKVYSNGETLPNLADKVTFANSNITVYAVWGLDDNGNGVPDALEAKVTYKVEKGYWYDAATGQATGSEIVCLRPLYKKSDNGVWKSCNATLGDSIPTGRAGNEGYTADGWYKNDETTKITIDAATPVTGNVTYTFKYVPEIKPDTYTVVLHLDGGTYTTAPKYTKTTDGYQYNLNAATDKVNPTITTLNKNGYEFKGWSLSKTAPQTLIGADETFAILSVQQNGLNGNHGKIDLYAVWQEIKYTVTYNLDGGTTTSNKTIFPDLTYGVDTPTIVNPTKAGYTFAGWEPKVAKKVTDNATYKAQWNRNYVPYYPPVPPTVKIEDDDALGLNTTDHFAYIVGYGNGEVRPQNNITRAEVATIFFRLLTDDVRDENLTKTNRYSDVAATSWYNTAVSTLSSMGIITGYPDGTFRPNAAITRAEFAAIAARFDNDGDKTAAKFSDIATHWAKDEISIAYNNGWITGYPDGTFGPQRDITRAETMTLVNRVLNRQPETEDDLLPNMTVWTDNANPNAWYYLAVQEATNSHYYKFKTNSKYEKWTELRETRDWTQLEK